MTSSLGRNHASVLTNRKSWEDICVTAGLASGDLCFPIIYAPELQITEFNSAIADLKV